jgi:hypothetical protein
MPLRGMYQKLKNSAPIEFSKPRGVALHFYAGNIPTYYLRLYRPCDIRKPGSSVVPEIRFQIMYVS